LVGNRRAMMKSKQDENIAGKQHDDLNSATQALEL
jgi:hypothetical protein